MTYREPAEIPPRKGIIDARRLAASVEQLEAAHAEQKRVEKEEARLRKIEEEKRARAKPSRIMISKDVGGVLLDIQHQSMWWRPLTITWSVVMVGALALVIWGAFAWTPVNFLAGLLAVFIIPPPAAGLFFALRRGRPVRLYVADNGFFGVYRKSPSKPFAMGRAAHLELDLRWDGPEMKKMNLEYGGRNILEIPCDRLSLKDVDLLNKFGQAARVKVD